MIFFSSFWPEEPLRSILLIMEHIFFMRPRPPSRADLTALGMFMSRIPGSRKCWWLITKYRMLHLTHRMECCTPSPMVAPTFENSLWIASATMPTLHCLKFLESEKEHVQSQWNRLNGLVVRFALRELFLHCARSRVRVPVEPNF